MSGPTQPVGVYHVIILAILCATVVALVWRLTI